MHHTAVHTKTTSSHSPTSCAKDSSAFSCIGSIEADKAGIASLIAYTHVNNCQGGPIFPSYTRVIVETNLQQYTISIKNSPVPTVENVTRSCCTAGKRGVSPQCHCAIWNVTNFWRKWRKYNWSVRYIRITDCYLAITVWGIPRKYISLGS